MKPLSAIALVLHLSSAAIILPAKPLTDPHFPSHQLSPSTATTSSPPPHHNQETPFDNAPVTPPHNTLPSHALAVPIPLESSYLQSLANPATHPPSSDPLVHTKDKSTGAHSALPSKPTSALPVLRKEDGERYWAAVKAPTKEEQSVTTIQLEGGKTETSKEAVSFSSGILRAVRMCPEHRGVTSRLYGGSPLMIAREYSDVLVVGVVLVFLVLVVVLEAKERCGGVRRFRRNRNLRHGKIYLDDDFESLYVVRKPMFLQPAPKGRSQSKWAKKPVTYDTDSGSDTAVEDGMFEYDGHAYEKV